MRGRDAEDLMKKDVGLELADEEQRECARIGLADDAGADGAAEVVGEDADGPARRDLVVLRVERDDEGRRVHLHGDRGADDVAEEGDHAAGELAEDHARIGGGVEGRDRGDEVGRGDAAIAHRHREELLLGGEVAEDRRGSHVERARDVREGRRGEPAGAEGDAGGLEDLLAGNARRTAHGVSKRMFTNRGLSMAVY